MSVKSGGSLAAILCDLKNLYHDYSHTEQGKKVSTSLRILYYKWTKIIQVFSAGTPLAAPPLDFLRCQD